MLVESRYDVGIFFVLKKIQLKFLQQLNLPRNVAKRDLPRTTPQLQLSKDLTMVHGGFGWVQMMRRKFDTKWGLCRQHVDLQKR
jgi:hypothetical protein